ncbi:alpha/beta-hydrolase [Xylariomycetidae sp. FL2044]|nr:alpha/beta-hydrolase [Xylariomycetidae sp. FL2044]
MAVTQKPTIVIVHGGWHVPESYSALIAGLESKGYEVHVPRLPSTRQVRPPNAFLDDDTDLIRSYVESLVRAGRTVLPILHSYGGQVGTNALYDLGLETRSAQGLRGGISRLVYLAGNAASEGSTMDTVAHFGQMHFVPIAFDIDEDGSSVHRHPAKLLVMGEGDEEAPEGTDAYLATFVRWNAKTMWEDLKHCAWRDIPVVYIYVTKDQTIPLNYQKYFVEGIEKTGKKVQTFELATGHCANFTACQGVVDVIEKVVSV